MTAPKPPDGTPPQGFDSWLDVMGHADPCTFYGMTWPQVKAARAELAALRAQLAEALSAAREFQADAKRVAERNALLVAVAKEAVTANSCALIDPADSTRYEDLEERLNNAIKAARAGGAL